MKSGLFITPTTKIPCPYFRVHLPEGQDHRYRRRLLHLPPRAFAIEATHRSFLQLQLDLLQTVNLVPEDRGRR